MTTPSPDTDHLKCAKCVFQNLADHLECLKEELILPQPWVYTHKLTTHTQITRCEGLVHGHQSLTDVLNLTFNWNMRAKTLDHLRLFGDRITRFQSNSYDESTMSNQYFYPPVVQKPPSVPLEDIYTIFPSLHALVTLQHHHDFFQLSPHATYVESRMTFEFGGKRDFAWKHCLCKDQLEFASTSQRVKKAWEALLKSSGQASPHQDDASPVTSLLASTSKSGTSKIRGSSNDWSY